MAALASRLWKEKYKGQHLRPSSWASSSIQPRWNSTLPQDKVTTLMALLSAWDVRKKKVTKRELLSLVGKLSFAAKVIPAGRIFLRRLIDLSTFAKKLHHHITLTASARADIRLSKDFFPGWNGVSLMLQNSGLAPLTYTCSQMHLVHWASVHIPKELGSWARGLNNN